MARLLIPGAAILLGACAGTAPVDPDRPDTEVVVDVDARVRVVTWNIQGLGTADSEEGVAERAILARLDADVVGLNEIDEGESGRLAQLAADVGYDVVFLPSGNPFGDLRNAVLARGDVQVEALTASALSGDRAANDVTRLPLRATLTRSGLEPLTVVVNHWKSGFDNTDTFRRAVDGTRTAQAADVAGPVVVMGDVNAELEDMPESPAVWSYAPSGLPRTLEVGQDVDSALDDGLPNDAFAPLLQAGLVPVEAEQLDGRVSTRPSSDRRIDWVLVSSDLIGDAAGEVYDSSDEGRGGLEKAGEAPDRYASETASDHLPVVVDLVVPSLQP